jgi:hypothetical protein
MLLEHIFVWVKDEPSVRQKAPYISQTQGDSIDAGTKNYRNIRPSHSSFVSQLAGTTELHDLRRGEIVTT